MTSQGGAGSGGGAKKGGPNWVMLVVGSLLIIPMLVVLALGFGEDPDDFVFSERDAPHFELKDLEGKVHKLSHGQPTVLNFWATWCVPCKAEHPLLQQTAQIYDDVQFLGVIYGDNPAKAKAYLKRAGGVYPNLIDPTGAVAASYGVSGVPESFFIDKEGILRYRHNGALTPETMDAGLKAIR